MTTVSHQKAGTFRHCEYSARLGRLTGMNARSQLTKAQRRMLLAIDAGYCHSKPAVTIGSRVRSVVTRLSLAGLVRLELPKGRLPLRWVVTAAGSWALGTFAADDLGASRRAA